LRRRRVVDDEPAHRAGGVGQKARPVGERDVLASRDVEVGLVQQRRRAEREREAAAPQVALGEPVQLLV
jgi:hypothetical protein